MAESGSGEIKPNSIEGDISGQVTVGNYILQIGSVHGGVVNIASGQKPGLRARPTPVYVLPRRFPGLLDRHAEISYAENALQSGQSIEFHGPPGIGKTALLRYIARHPVTADLPDGVIYLSGRGQGSIDLVQSLFYAFYDSDAPYKPSEVELRSSLLRIRALILIDDVDSGYDEIEMLFDTLPECSFILAAEKRQLLGGEISIRLSGIPLEDAFALFERELGRPLAAEERQHALKICEDLGGHPLSIIQKAALFREERPKLAEVASSDVGPLPDEVQQIQAALWFLGGAATADQLAAITEHPDAGAALEKLVRRRFVQPFGLQGESYQYQLTGSQEPALKQVKDIQPLLDRALPYFTGRAARYTQDRSLVTTDRSPALFTLDWAIRAGRWQEALSLALPLAGGLLSDVHFYNEAIRAWEAALQAARMVGDESNQAYVLQQLGIQALALEDTGTARAYLYQALVLQERLGKKLEAAKTLSYFDNLRPLRVFLCHSSGDKPAVRALYFQLKRDSIDPWLDVEKLLPGQDWEVEIEKAVKEADVVLVCLSLGSITKTGFVQKEIKFALDKAEEQPEGVIYIIPLRLEECAVPRRLLRWQYVDLFQAGGYEKLMVSLRARAKDIIFLEARSH